MKQISLSLLLLGSCSELSAMNSVMLPSKKEIRKNLSALGLDDFTKKTRLDKTLGGKQKYPGEVVKEVNSALHDYNTKKPLIGGGIESVEDIARFMQLSKPKIIKSILKKQPEAIIFLESNDVL